jgi:hypothetical protein
LFCPSTFPFEARFTLELEPNETLTVTVDEDLAVSAPNGRELYRARDSGSDRVARRQLLGHWRQNR